MTERKHLAYICAPFRGDVKQNIEKAKEYARYVYELGLIPVTPHVMFPFLDDEKQEERESAMQMDLELLSKCDELWIFGSMTEGMQKEFEFARDNGIRCVIVDKRNVDESEDKKFIRWLRGRAELFREFAQKKRRQTTIDSLISESIMMERIAERLERLG